jgi:polygalacturonase
VEINTPATARNTDGVDPVSENDVTIFGEMIQNCDDCVAVKSNPPAPSASITVDGVNCYGSHGLSVGSQTAGGICNVLFENSTLNGYPGRQPRQRGAHPRGEPDPVRERRNVQHQHGSRRA